VQRKGLLDDLGDLVHEPRIDTRGVGDLLDRVSGGERGLDQMEPAFGGDGEGRQDGPGGPAGHRAEVEPRPLHRTPRLPQGFLERAADGHDLANGLHG
jgi:hypothetical protein